MMLRTIPKNTYVDNFLKSLDKGIFDYIIDIYEKACVPKFNSQESIEFNAINTEFNDDTFFSTATEFCKKLRNAVRKFEQDAMTTNPSQKDWNYDLWLLRVEEIFMLKLFINISAKHTNDTILMTFMPHIKKKGNTSHAYFPNVVGLKYNDLIVEILKIYENAMNNKIKYTIGDAINIKDDKHADSRVATLTQENQALSAEITELTNKVNAANIEKSIWMERMQALIKTVTEMKTELAEVKAEQKIMKDTTSHQLPSESGEGKLKEKELEQHNSKPVDLESSSEKSKHTLFGGRKSSSDKKEKKGHKHKH